MAVLYWTTRGAGATILPDGTAYPKDEDGRVDVPDALVEEFKALGYTNAPPAAQEPATEPSAAPADPAAEPENPAPADGFGRG